MDRGPSLTSNINGDQLRCGAHVPVRWSRFCAAYRYEPLAQSRAGAGEKALRLHVIDQQVTGFWECHGKKGHLRIEAGDVFAGSHGENFACRHIDATREGSNILALQPAALDDCDEALFDQQVLRGLHLPDLSRALYIENADEFESFVFEVFNDVSRASLRSASSRRGPNLRVQRMKRFIEQHAFENISLDDIAASIALSPFTCIRQFKEVTGIAPLQYLNSIRLERARKLLRNSRLSIGEIASRVAIRDRFYFTRWFSKHTGFSPQRFRDVENR